MSPHWVTRKLTIAAAMVFPLLGNNLDLTWTEAALLPACNESEGEPRECVRSSLGASDFP